MIWKAMKNGFLLLWRNHKRMIFIFYLANLFCGLILMVPFRAMLSEFIGYSLMGEKLGGRLDMDFLFEFFTYQRAMPLTIFTLLLFVPVIYWLFNLFLSGGAFVVLAQQEKYQPAQFWSGAANYFGRFVRLVLCCIPVFVILFCLQFLWTAFEKLVFGSDPYQFITYWGGWIQVGLRYLSLLLCWLVLDYARIQAVLTDEYRMRFSLREGIKFICRNFSNTFGLSFLLFIIGIILLIAYNPIADSLNTPNPIVIIMLFVVQQAYIFFRMMLRLTLYASEMQLYKELMVEEKSPIITPTHDIYIEGAAA